MTTRSLSALFAPRSIVLVGANDRDGSVGQILSRNLLDGGFDGEVQFFDRTANIVLGRPVARSIADVRGTPDLAVIATPALAIPQLIGELGAKGCRAAIVISAGFEGSEDSHAELRRALLAAARPHGLRIVGPNCLGVISPVAGVNASFARLAPPPGNIALVAQSGAVAAAAIDWAPAHGAGFSHVVTLGDSLDVDVADVLDYLADDPRTDAVLIYLEGLADARRFMSAARRVASNKRIVCLKGGRSQAGGQAAFSHTRALAGADGVYSAAFRRAGILQVDTLDELLETGLMCAYARRPGALAILTNGGGAGVLATDALERHSGALAVFSKATEQALAIAGSRAEAARNPVDILGDAPPPRYAACLAPLLAAPEVDAVLAVHCPTGVSDPAAAADALIAGRDASTIGKPVFAAWLGEPSVRAARERLVAGKIPTFPSAETAVAAYAALFAVEHCRSLSLEAPDAEGTRDLAAARDVVARATSSGRASLEPLEVQALLKAYGLDLLELAHAPTPEAAGRLAAKGAPAGYALKLQSPDITHKSDVGGVVLGLNTGAEVARAARAMLSRVKAERPAARVDGFMVQPIADRPNAQEVLVGLSRDPTFGPVIVVGHGGVAVEAIRDRALGLAPLNSVLAKDMIGQTRVARLLAGYRNRPAVDEGALIRVLTALAQLAIDLPEVAEIDLNPVLCDDRGALILDARVSLLPVGAVQVPPAIAPYAGGDGR